MGSYYIVYQGDIVSGLEAIGLEDFIILNPTLVVVYTDENFDDTELDEVKEIIIWNKSRPLSSLIEISNDLENGETVSFAVGTDFIDKNPYISITGRDVIIATIDSGIDYLHPDFIDDNGKSRIISIWDQTSDRFEPPEGIIFGSEITNEEINKAIAENDSTLTVDNTGTGTIAAGIAGGNGRLNSAFRGVAPECEFVVVKLKEYEGVYSQDRKNYSEGDFLVAFKYILDVAQREGKSIIINLTIGAMSDSGSIVTLLEIFSSVPGSGVFLVSGAGNQANTDIHDYGRFTSLNEVRDIIIQVGEQENLEIVLMTNGPDKISATIISPSGEVGYTADYSTKCSRYRGKFNIEDTSYSMLYSYPWISTGKERLEIILEDVKPGIWSLRLTPEYIVTGEYDIYLPNKNLISPDTRFINSDSEATITAYGTSQNVITVGAYNDKTNSMWIGSSRGPIRSIGIKPDIVAPGIDIIGPYLNQTYNTGIGTGISSSITCGAIALIVEYLNKQSTVPRLSLYAEVMKTYLMLGATKKAIYSYPNVSEGYGVLNLQNTIKEISDNL